MPGIKDQHRIDDMRERLYARNAKDVRVDRHGLSRSDDSGVKTGWEKPVESNSSVTNTHAQRMDIRTAMPKAAETDRPSAQPQASQVADGPEAPKASHFVDANDPPPKKRSYRIKLLFLSGIILLVGILFSAWYLLFSINGISSENIEIQVNSPSSMGAGEVFPIDITITNNNPVPIISGTIIVQYPPGTRDAEDSSRQLRTDRIIVDRIGVGESLDIPVRAILFGEENDEKEITARLNYRIDGTNSILERALEPITVRITSAPIVLRVNTVERVTAGQEVEINIELNSNAPSDLSNILVTASYPSVFDFSESSPSPAFSNNTWRIDTLPSGESRTITARGVFTGQQSDEFVIDFSAGLPREDNPLALGSIFSTFRSEFFIEQPFININFTMNGESGRSVVLEGDRRTDVRVEVRNTLDSPVYDMRAVARISGNAMNQDGVQVNDGFYDSFDDTVRFNISTNRDLERVESGGRRVFIFSINPRQVATGQIEVEFDVFARRVSDASAQEDLLGTVYSAAQFTSPVSITPRLGYSDTPFGDSGPIPPVAEIPTTYTITLTAAAGLNDIVDGQLTTSLPTYVEWLDTFQGPGSVTFNPVNQELMWSTGSITAEETAELSFQVRFRPSRSQIGNTIFLLNTQHFRATDRFTGTTVRAEGPRLNSELPRSSGFERENGQVRASESAPAMSTSGSSDVAEDDED